MLPAHLETNPDNQRKHYEIREVPAASPFRQLVKHNTCFFAEWPHLPNTTHFIIKGKLNGGKIQDVLLPISVGKFTKLYAQWVNGTHAQVAFHMLDIGMREFIMTGTTPQEWDEMFGDEE